MVFRRLLRVPWTARRTNKSILKEIIGRNDTEAEAPIFCSGYWKRPWCWERLKAGEERSAEDEVVGWHHQLNEHEFEQASRVGDRQGSLACSVHGAAKCQTWLSTWTKLNIIAQNYVKIYIIPKFLKSFSMNIKTELRINIKGRFEEIFSNHIMPSVSKAISLKSSFKNVNRDFVPILIKKIMTNLHVNTMTLIEGNYLWKPIKYSLQLNKFVI